MAYLFAADQRARLEAVEELLDPGTIRVLDRLELAAKSSCLEIGAGGGSIARWLAARFGHVVATDIDTSGFEAGSHRNLEIKTHDIVGDPLDEATFDLIHARLVLEHLKDREHVVHKLTRALRPGGWLMLESVDYISAIPISTFGANEHERTQAVRLQVFGETGLDQSLGRRLPQLLRRAGLQNVGNEGRVWVMEGGSPGARWFKLSLAHLRPRLIGPGLLTEHEVDRMLEVFDDPRWSAFSPIIMAAWGRLLRAPSMGADARTSHPVQS